MTASVRAAICAWLLALGPGCDAVDESLLRSPSAAQTPSDDDGGTRPPDPTAGRPASRPMTGTPEDASVPVPDSGPTQCTGADELASCSRPNALTACVETQCLLVECVEDWVDCDGEAENGCEARLDSVENCGLCGALCALPNAETTCADGVCAFRACRGAFDDCDQDPGNGCETSLESIEHCGACTTSCTAPPNAAPGCKSAQCGVGLCLGPFGDCDQDPGNGCEEPLSSLTHCGGCTSPCAPSGGTGNCDTGDCAITGCDAPLVDCNGLVSDGCETTLDTVLHCGACGAACELPNALATRCSGAPPGCAVDHACVPGTLGCVEDAPENGCAAPFGDCNRTGSDGCERRLDTLSDCGSCGAPCAAANAITVCTAGECEVVGCEPGFDDCGSGACSSLASSSLHCGACNAPCPGGRPNCRGGVCTDQSCPAGTADCDAAGGSCETSLTSLAHCGLCGVPCGPLPHATASCSSQRCAIATCDPGFDDCDGVVHNGCEVDLRTLAACGSCAQSCSIPFAEESCASGTCTLVQCDPGRADCNGALTDGCETSIALPADCGRCGNDCNALPHVLSGGCDQGSCDLVCDGGYADCDGNPDNGCEADLSSAQSCGACGNDCGALANVQSASCNGELCVDLVCEPGFADCDGISANGCERSTLTLSDCGGCNSPCALPHATASCATGTCTVTACDTGYDDCNGQAQDGCEASLNDDASCGLCGNACFGESVCENGQCMCTQDADCGAGAICCDGVCSTAGSVCSWWPCPVVTLSRPLLHCGACGVFCPLVSASFFCCAPAF